MLLWKIGCAPNIRLSGAHWDAGLSMAGDLLFRQIHEPPGTWRHLVLLSMAMREPNGCPLWHRQLKKSDERQWHRYHGG
jgi:hypothetical protein